MPEDELKPKWHKIKFGTPDNAKEWRRVLYAALAYGAIFYGIYKYFGR